MPSQMRIPFGIDATGGVSSTTSAREIDQMNLITLVSTQPGERAMRPAYGVNTRSLLFEATDGMLTSRLQSEITSAATNYAPEVEVGAITFSTDEAAQGKVSVAVTYSPGGGRLDTGTDTVTATVTAGG